MIPIPEATEPKNAKKEARQAAYNLYVDTSQAIKQMLDPVENDTVHNMVGDHMQLLMSPDDLEEMTLPIEVVKQMALLASGTLTRYLYERRKRQ